MGIQEHLIEADKLETYGPSGECHLQFETKAIRRFEKISQLALSHLRHY